MPELKLLATADGEGRTELAARVGDHEIDMVGSDFLGSDDEVTLILAVLVVDNDHELALAEIFDSLGDGVKLYIFHNRS